MAIKALINGKVQAGVTVDDRGLQYGDSVFETIAVAEAGPLCLDEHLPLAGRLRASVHLAPGVASPAR